MAVHEPPGNRLHTARGFLMHWRAQISDMILYAAERVASLQNKNIFKIFPSIQPCFGLLSKMHHHNRRALSDDAF